MQRRAFLGGLAAMLAPAAAVAQVPAPGYGQTPAPYGQAPMAPAPYGQAPAPYGQTPVAPAPYGQPPTDGSGRPRTPIMRMNWDDIGPNRRRKLQQRLADPGAPPLAPDQARQMWDSMTPRQRRDRLRASAPADGQRRRRTPMDQTQQ